MVGTGAPFVRCGLKSGLPGKGKVLLQNSKRLIKTFPNKEVENVISSTKKPFIVNKH